MPALDLTFRLSPAATSADSVPFRCASSHKGWIPSRVLDSEKDPLPGRAPRETSSTLEAMHPAERSPPPSPIRRRRRRRDMATWVAFAASSSVGRPSLRGDGGVISSGETSGSMMARHTVRRDTERTLRP